MKQHISKARACKMFGTIIHCNEMTNIASIAGIDPQYYNSGMSGWNWNLYEIDGVAVVDGYRNFPKCSARVDYFTAKEFCKQLEHLETREERQAAVTRFIKTAICGAEQ